MFSPLVVACVVLLLVCEGQSFDPGASKALVSLRAAYPGAIGKVLKDQQVHKDHKVYKALKALMVLKDVMELQAHRVLPDLKVLKVMIREIAEV